MDVTRQSVRVFNNFTAPTANDNQDPDPDFPGFLGASMAIWKGTVEWNSSAHGDGGGDPTQLHVDDGGADCRHRRELRQQRWNQLKGTNFPRLPALKARLGRPSKVSPGGASMVTAFEVESAF